ncbi:MAG TPA: hypothetical protein VH120_12075, partial [Gemmataceae bacterium]|nr:hypothetical protein [Gemmataceae bacterium]
GGESATIVDSLLADCRQEMAGLDHLAVGQSEVFDRFDFLLAAADGWAGMRRRENFPPELHELLPAAWVRPFAEVRPKLVRILAQIAAAPYVWLRHFDTIAEQNRAALAAFANLLGQYEERLVDPPAVPHSPADLARLVQEFLADTALLEYAALRSHLLAFCLQEAVAPDLVVSVAPATEGGNVLRQNVPGDLPLRFLCWACRLAWA